MASVVGNMQPTAPRDSRSIGKKLGEINAEHQAWLDAQPVMTGCGFCSWAFEGTAAEGREQARVHRAEAHPELQVPRRRRGAGGMPMQPVKDPVSRAEGEARAARVAATHERRAAETAVVGLEETGVARVAAHADAAPVSSSPTSSLPNPYGLVRARRGYAWPRETALQAIRDFVREHGHPPAQRDCTENLGRLPSAPTLTRMFGSYADAIEAAGFPRPTRSTSYRRNDSSPTPHMAGDDQEPRAALTAPAPSLLPGDEESSLERAQAVDPPAVSAPAAFQAADLTSILQLLRYALLNVRDALDALERLREQAA